MTPPLSRTNVEAHLYMELQPCACGEWQFERRYAVVALDDGDLGGRYTGPCARCGAEREFIFRLPAEIVPPPGGGAVRFGGDEPSQLLDPGEWLWVSDAYASEVSADPTDLDEQQWSAARANLARAVAALDEVLKFLPDGAETVPVDAFFNARGRQVYDREAGRFRRTRLATVRQSYLEQAVQLG